MFPTFPLAHYGRVADTVSMAKRSTQTKRTDSKGRVTLGDAYANQTLIVEDRGYEIVLTLARVIPEREAWLYENRDALAAVRSGLKQAASGRFSDGPDLGEADRLAEDLDAD